MKSESFPLVSVIVMSYNSGSTIYETLESIKKQSYPNIELIVSDDCSSDKTHQVVNEWIKNNSERFSNFCFVTSPVNTGIPSNSNRGIAHAHGQWIKTIAADDLLMPDSISIYMKYVSLKEDCNVLFSKIKRFKIKDGRVTYLEDSDNKIDLFVENQFSVADSHRQFKLLLERGCLMAAPTVFFKKEVLDKNKFPESYRFLDDYPMWLKLTRNGYKLSYLPQETVLYRVGESVSNSSMFYYSHNFMRSKTLFFWNECLDFFKEENMQEAYNKYRKMLLLYELTEAFLQNKPSLFHNIIRNIMNVMIRLFANYKMQ